MNVWDLLLKPEDNKNKDDEEYLKRTCIWLRDAGFPQYVQMYNDGEFPLSLKLIEEDHCDFDGASLMALFRRIEILNNSAETKSESTPLEDAKLIRDPVVITKTSKYQIIDDNVLSENEEDEDDDKENLSEQIALSSNWSFEPRTRRWSHIEPTQTQIVNPQDKYLGISRPRPYIPKSNENHKSNLNTDNYKNFESIPEISTEIIDTNKGKEIPPSADKDSNYFTFFSLDSQNSESSFDRSSPYLPNTNAKLSKDVFIQRSSTMKVAKSDSKPSHHYRSFRSKKGDKQNHLEKRKGSPNIDINQTRVDHFEKHQSKHLSEGQDKKMTKSEPSSVRKGHGNHLNDHKKINRSDIISNMDPIISHMESDINSLDNMTSKLKMKPSSGSAPNSPVLRKKQTSTPDLNKDIVRLSDIGRYTDRRSNDNRNESCTDGNKISSHHTINKIEHLSTNKTANRSQNNDTESSSKLYNLFEFSVSQVNIFRKVSVLGSTLVLENYCHSSKNVFNWKLPKLLPQLMKQKLPSDESINVFGINLWVCQSRYGQPYPPAILNIFRYLREQGPSAQGIFRKAGMKSKSKLLMQEIEANYNFNFFDEYSVFDVADVLKCFLRDLPDRLLTGKVSATLMAIYSYVPKELQLKELRLSLLSLPDENRIALEILIEFLSFFSSHSEITKMDIKNLSLIFSPNLFSLTPETSPNYSKNSFKMKRSSGPIAKQMAEQNASNLCLTDMITNINSIFKVTEETYKKGSNKINTCEPRDISELIPMNLTQEWLFEKINNLKNDITHKSGWTNIQKDFIRKLHGQNVAIEHLSYRKIGSHENNIDGVALRTWKVVVDVDASPQWLFSCIKDKRHLWDLDVTTFEVLQEINDYVDVVRFTSCNIDGSSILRGFDLLRGYQLGVGGSSDVIVSESVNIQHLPNCDNSLSVNDRSSVTGHVYCDNFWIDAQSKRTCRVTWISKVDIRGHHSDWYSLHWGHALVRRASNLKLFSQSNTSLQSSSTNSINTPTFVMTHTQPLDDPFKNITEGVLSASRETNL